MTDDTGRDQRREDMEKRQYEDNVKPVGTR